MLNKDRTESGYAFFDVDSETARDIVAAGPHQLGAALINCKIAADTSQLSSAQKEEMKRKLYVSNLPFNTTDFDLLHLFQTFGRLSKAYLVRNKADGSCRNFGFVIFEAISDLENFLSVPRTIKFKGRRLTIKKAVDRQTQTHIKQKEQLGYDEDLGLRSDQSGDGPEVWISTKYQILAQSQHLQEDEANYRFNYIALRRRMRNLTSLGVLKPRFTTTQNFSPSHLYTGTSFAHC